MSRSRRGTFPTRRRLRPGNCRYWSRTALPVCPRTASSSAPRSDLGRRTEFLHAGRQRVGRPLDHLLEQKVHEQEQRLGFENQQDAGFLLVIVEVLVHAGILDQHDVTGLPLHITAVMHVMAVALEYVEHRAVEMAVFLP